MHSRLLGTTIFLLFAACACWSAEEPATTPKADDKKAEEKKFDTPDRPDIESVKKANEAYLAALKTAKEKYAKALQALVDAEQKKGNLDGIEELKPEIAKLLGEGTDPSETEFKNPAAKKAQEAFNKELDVAKKKYMADLGKAQAEEVKAGRLEEAKKIKEYVASLASGATSKPDSKTEDTPSTGEAKWISQNALYDYLPPAVQYLHFIKQPWLLSAEDAKGDFAFCATGAKSLAIVIDLQSICEVTAAYIENRKDVCQDRAASLAIWLSADGIKKGKEIWSATEAQQEWNASFKGNNKTRFLIVGLKADVTKEFHLRKIKIFGRGSSELDVAKLSKAFCGKWKLSSGATQTFKADGTCTESTKNATGTWKAESGSIIVTWKDQSWIQTWNLPLHAKDTIVETNSIGVLKASKAD